MLGFAGILLWLCKRRRAGMGLLIAGVLTGYLFSIPLTAGLLNRPLQHFEPLVLENLPTRSPDVIVVLAGGLRKRAPEYGTNDMALRTLGRVRYAARLAHATGLPVLASGGYAYGDGVPEAQLMQQALTEEFRVATVWIEDTSRTTWENAANSAPLLRVRGLATVVLVTSASHMARAKMVFERAGLTVIPAPTLFFSDRPELGDLKTWLPSIHASWEIYYALHEWVGMIWYRGRAQFTPVAGDSPPVETSS